MTTTAGQTAVANEPPSQNMLCTLHFVKLSAFMASVGEVGKNRAIIYTLPASHLTVFEFNPNTSVLLTADFFPLIYNVRAQYGDQWCSAS